MLPSSRRRLSRPLSGAAALLLIAGTLAPATPLRAEEGSAALRERLARAELLAGLTTVEGPGVTVTLRHSPKPVPKGADRSGFMLHDQDVNAVLNALRAAGAEALAIGTPEAPLERVLANTAAVEVKDGVEVNNRVFRAPYRIVAIGEARDLRAELYRKNGVVKRSGLDVMDMIQVTDSSRLLIPAARGVAPFRYARTVGDRTAVAAAPPAFQPAVREMPAPKPADAAPGRPSPRTPAAAPAIPVALRTGSLFGGKNLNKFHLTGCRFGERIEPAQRVQFSTPSEAQQNNRVPCRICRPDRSAAL